MLAVYAMQRKKKEYECKTSIVRSGSPSSCGDTTENNNNTNNSIITSSGSAVVEQTPENLTNNNCLKVGFILNPQNL